MSNHPDPDYCDCPECLEATEPPSRSWDDLIRYPNPPHRASRCGEDAQVNYAAKEYRKT